MTQTADFQLTRYAGEVRQRVDAALQAYTNFAAGCPVRLREAIQYSLLAPGKRLRPMLVLMAAEACGGTAEAALPAACAVEMIHTYSLIHDDLPAMDDDDLRRGLPTCHKKFDEATAILAGDALLALAFEVLAKDVRPPAVAAACGAALAESAGACHLVGGQADDMDGGWQDGGLRALEGLHQRKTGAMIRVSLRLGAMIAGADQSQLDALDEYGWRLGLAFQVTDDLLDVCGDETQVGKRLGKDSHQGKVTFPTLLGIDGSRQRAQQLITEACDALAPFVTRTGGLEAVARYVLERNR
ncbi:MAG: polyprenyl synthetase family protein [Thermoguttaceae bacterium]|jgi:geranylgeranyl diphosphate synthase type II